MFSLNCSYYTKFFPTVEELLEDIIATGMDPNYEITNNTIPTGVMAIDLIQL